MATVPVQFTYSTGIAGDVFSGRDGRLHGSWTASGRYSDSWTVVPMHRMLGEDGCVCFHATANLDSAERGTRFNWGVSLVDGGGREQWAIPTEVKDVRSRERHRSFVFSGNPEDQRYYLTHCRRLGANKQVRAGGGTGIRFAVWAPNARAVAVVMGTVWDRRDPARTPVTHSLPFSCVAGGYIADDGTGMDTAVGLLAMHAIGDGVWETDPDDPALADYRAFEHRPYMFRVTRDDGTIAYRTDLYSRAQIGYGRFRPPAGTPYVGYVSELDGSVSCSVVVDPDTMTKYFKEEPPYLTTPPPPMRIWPEMHYIDTDGFWADEFTHRRPPSRVDDMIIYELHMGALGYGSPRAGTMEDVIQLLDHLEALGVNAIELLPLSEFGGGAENWGYSTSHHCALEYGGGGRDQYKFFIKEAHRRGFAVIMDVVYNHFVHDAERAQYRYDSNQPDRDIYYWYEGSPSDYRFPDGGYLDNMSTAFAPRYHEEMVRKLFISSAVALVREFHVDGFRVDQTTSIHSYNRLHADGREIGAANVFGAKLLRELARTLRLVKPEVVLMAEDHSDWEDVTRPLDEGGLGFDLRWYADFYHHLAGDTDKGSDAAKLLFMASMADERPLALDYFAGALTASGTARVVYNESHDEAGNSKGPLFDPAWTDPEKKHTSHRSLVLAVNGAPLVGATRWYAEARCRFAWAVTVLSAGVPMHLFGEEVGAVARFKYGKVLENREDLAALRSGAGANLFRFYAEINRLRLSSGALRSREIDVLHADRQNRVLVFRRWHDGEDVLVLGSLKDWPYDRGYRFSNNRLPDGDWQEIFNTDGAAYGGNNVGNAGGTRRSSGGEFEAIIPANGVVVFRRVGA